MATAVVMTADATNAALDDLIETGAFDGSGDLILTTRGGGDINAGSPIITIADASTTVKGLVELATTAETTAGSDAVRAVTPAGLAGSLSSIVPPAVPAASATVQGKVELATDAEATTGTDTTRATTPANVAAVVAANNTANVTPRPLGVVARRTRTSNSSTTTSTTGLAVIKLSWSAVSGRLYKVCSNGLHLTGGLNDEVAARVFMTTNGVDPTTSDTEVCSLPRGIANAGRYEIVVVNEFVVAGSTATHKVTLFVARTAGTAGSAKIDAVGANMKFWVEDCGVPVADAGSGADV
jgi:hypothetical protein